MNRLPKLLRGLLLLVLLGFPTLLHAQTALTATTTSAAVANAAATTVAITSATGFTASTNVNERWMVVDREVMKIIAINGTTLTVQRGRAPGLPATGHRSGAIVYFVPNDQQMSRDDKAGLCSVAPPDPLQNAAFHPVLNVQNGKAFYCYNGVWTAGPYMGLGQRSCAVTQITSRATGVTCQGLTGAITTDTTSLAAEAAAAFVVTDASVAIGDTVVASIRSGSNSGNTDVTVSTVTAGSFTLRVSDNNVAAGTAETGAIIINFAVIKVQ